MELLIKKTTNKIEKHSHISGKDVSLRFILPLLRAMHSQYASAFQTIDTNFDNVFESLGIGEQGFVDDALAFVTSYNAFVDQILVASGFFEPDPEVEGGYRVSASMPPELQNELKQQQGRMVSFLQQLESLRLDEEDFDDEEEDFDDQEVLKSEVIESEESLEASENTEELPVVEPEVITPPANAEGVPPSGEAHA